MCFRQGLPRGYCAIASPALSDSNDKGSPRRGNMLFDGLGTGPCVFGVLLHHQTALVTAVFCQHDRRYHKVHRLFRVRMSRIVTISKLNRASVQSMVRLFEYVLKTTELLHTARSAVQGKLLVFPIGSSMSVFARRGQLVPSRHMPEIERGLQSLH